MLSSLGQMAISNMGREISRGNAVTHTHTPLTLCSGTSTPYFCLCALASFLKAYQRHRKHTALRREEMFESKKEGRGGKVCTQQKRCTVFYFSTIGVCFTAAERLPQQGREYRGASRFGATVCFLLPSFILSSCCRQSFCQRQHLSLYYALNCQSGVQFTALHTSVFTVFLFTPWTLVKFGHQ